MHVCVLNIPTTIFTSRTECFHSTKLPGAGSSSVRVPESSSPLQGFRYIRVCVCRGGGVYNICPEVLSQTHTQPDRASAAPQRWEDVGNNCIHLSKPVSVFVLSQQRSKDPAQQNQSQPFWEAELLLLLHPNRANRLDTVGLLDRFL